jgi:succinate dehydrogenase flavin-adding protein (antitoxin of CptAB toxin-antitoxin module)
MHAATYPDAAELRRLQWRCRRGLLENDLVLTKFLEKHAADLDMDRLQELNRLLAYDDADLWDIISGRAESGDPDLAEMIGWLRAC